MSETPVSPTGAAAPAPPPTPPPRKRWWHHWRAMTYVGLDLHKRYITASALDEAGALLAEHGRLPADDATLVGWLAARPTPVTVAMEATLCCTWLHDRLTAAGYTAVVVICALVLFVIAGDISNRFLLS